MVKVTLQNPQTFTNIPKAESFQQWANTALAAEQVSGNITIRIVDEAESQSLNSTYREKENPTNVLAFPYNSDGLIGDIVICAPVVLREALQQEKEPIAHWAHLVIHGCLHCVGYDHIEEEDREQMETIEIKLLQNLGYSNPYDEDE